MNLSQIGEFGLIEQLRGGLKLRAGTRIGIGDDCAILDSLHTPVVTMDALVEGVHFRRDWTTPRALGRKSMAVNVSDLAASGARPVAAFVSLSASARDDVEFIRALYAGFEDAAQRFDFTIAGGDTTKSRSDLIISIALIGEVLEPKRGPILRSGAQVGDILLVSGNLGDSAAGLAILQAQESEISPISPAARGYLLKRHHEPTPQLEWMKQLLKIGAGAIHAALDLSDGLVGDAAHLARKSGVQVEIEAELLPISGPCQEAARVLALDATELALSGGEDYELLLAVDPEDVDLLQQEAQDAAIVLTRIGKCATKSPTQSPVVVCQGGDLRPMQSAWTHF